MDPNLFNTLLFFVSVALYLGGVLGAYRLFGKTGLYIFTAFAVILANIEAMKVVTMFGMSLTLGNALYASTFLATDILSENHGKKDANKAVNIGLFVAILWTVATALMLKFVPGAEDFISPSMNELFSMVPRISLASIFTYSVVQRLDVFFYHIIWEKTGHSKKFLWLRNNGSTLLSQLLDSTIFTLIAFWGVFDGALLVELIISTYILKVIIALCDTPFLYLARRLKKYAEEN